MELTESCLNAGERLKYARTRLHISGEKFASGLGITKTAISALETGKNSITSPMALAIEYVYGISSKWILDGTAPPFSRPIDEGPSSGMGRPLIEGSPSCGPGGEIKDPGPNALRFTFHLTPPYGLGQRAFRNVDDLFYAHVAGNSMSPTIRDGDLVLLDTDIDRRLHPRPSAIYLVRRQIGDPDSRVKRVRLDEGSHQLVLSSDNPAYPSLTVALDDVPLHQVILGQVLWVGHFLVNPEIPERDW